MGAQDSAGQNVFHTAQNVSQLMGQYAGAASMCWRDGVFQAEEAANFAKNALVRLSELLNSEAKGVVTEAYKGEDPVVRDQLIGLFADIVEEIFKV